MCGSVLRISLLLFVALCFIAGDAWTSLARWNWLPSQQLAFGSSRSMADKDIEEDWRDFRARLVAQEQKETTGTDDSPPVTVTDNSWAYEMGDIIEEGSVILSRHEHDFCYGLKQQYFHKSIMLVLEHEDGIMTDGIILNRPTSRVLTDKDGNSWNIWYGGPVRGIHDQEGDLSYTCLHSLSNDVAKRVSNKIIKDIQVRTRLAARELPHEMKCHHSTMTEFLSQH